MFFMVPHIMITVAKKLIRFQVKERQQNQRKSNRRGGRWKDIGCDGATKFKNNYTEPNESREIKTAKSIIERERDSENREREK